MSHLTKGPQGTTFNHNGGFDGDVLIRRPDFPAGVYVPFEDLRELVLQYLANKLIEKVENANGDDLEQILMRSPS